MSYLANLYRGAPADHYLAVWSKTLGITEFYPIADLETAEQRLLELSNCGELVPADAPAGSGTRRLSGCRFFTGHHVRR